MRRWAILLGAMGLYAARAQAASLYLPAGDGRLRSDLQLLIDGGVIDLAVLAWPLPRSDAERALAGAGAAVDSPYEAVLARVRAAVSGAEPARSVRVVAGRPALLREFGTAAREEGTLSVRAGMGGARWSASGVLSAVTSAADHQPLRLDGSELTLRLGNWLVGPNLLDRWWGPGQQGSLILSNNARPIPALMLDRATSVPFGLRGLRWIGPWRFTALLGRADGSRGDVDHPYFMGMRFEMRPAPWLEFAAQRTAMFCGAGRDCGADVVWKMLVGHDNRGINTDAASEPGNGLAGFDLRLKLPGPLPVALYTQMIGEDVHDYLPVKYLGQFGAELGGIASSGAVWRAYAEYSDTTCSFWRHTNGDPPPKFGCAYNSGVYPIDGYRYRSRSIGHTSDNDARLWVGGLRYAPARGGEWRARLASGTLNRDNLDPAAPDGRNTVARLATGYRAAELGWSGAASWGRLDLQLGVERRHPAGGRRATEGYGFASWERGF